jgi:glutamate N-acetyltransferase/amino-acid N-acetyltransferase
MERGFLREVLPACARQTFNTISIDGDQSTSDMAILVSSGRKPPVEEREFEQALLAVCRGLAEDIVRNGEGVGHLIRLRLTTALEEERARGAGKAVLNSPLVKTAVFGNDPNVGRIVSALGDHLGNAGVPLNLDRLTIRMGGIELFSRGAFRLDPDKEERLAGYMRSCAIDPQDRGYPRHDRAVELEILLGEGGRSYEFLGADLSYDYVRENADYRS